MGGVVHRSFAGDFVKIAGASRVPRRLCNSAHMRSDPTAWKWLPFAALASYMSEQPSADVPSGHASVNRALLTWVYCAGRSVPRSKAALSLQATGASTSSYSCLLTRPGSFDSVVSYDHSAPCSTDASGPWRCSKRTDRPPRRSEIQLPHPCLDLRCLPQHTFPDDASNLGAYLGIRMRSGWRARQVVVSVEGFRRAQVTTPTVMNAGRSLPPDQQWRHPAAGRRQQR